MGKTVFVFFACCLLLTLCVTTNAQVPATFTYQGRLTLQGEPINGQIDLQFRLFDAATDGTQLDAINVNDLDVTDGLVTVELNFGSDAFAGAERWLQIGVRPYDSSAAFTTLSPRQEIFPAPYAIKALNDATDDTVSWSEISSIVGTGSSQVAQGSHSHNDMWKLTGNSGTTAGTHFLGTTDNKALEFKVNGNRALRLEPHYTSPNVLAGHKDNTINSGLHGAVISGGGANGFENEVTDVFGTVAGGMSNVAGDGAGTSDDSSYAAVGGGQANEASGKFSAVSGGFYNKATGDKSTVGGGESNDAASTRATVAGGYQNSALGTSSCIGGGATNTTEGFYSTVAGGASNGAYSDSSTVGGGSENTAIGTSATVSGGANNIINDADNAAIGGGAYNRITADFGTIGGGGYTNSSSKSTSSNRVTDNYGTVGGGGNNVAGDGAGTVADAYYATVGGGGGNTASSSYTTVSGGLENEASDAYSTVGGGLQNVASGYGATIGGGDDNQALDTFCSVGGGTTNIANGDYVTVGGGYTNTASNAGTTIGGGHTNTVLTNYSTISGGKENVIGGSGITATIGGGISNSASGTSSTIAGGDGNSTGSAFATVAGGEGNSASGNSSVIGGGNDNVASNLGSTIAGGRENTSSGQFAFVGSGMNNEATGNESTVPGGYHCSATADYATACGGANNVAAGAASFAAGYRAKANHAYSFVWANNTSADTTTDRNGQFKVKATGGAQFDVTSNHLSPPGVKIAVTGSTGVALHAEQTSSDAVAVLTNKGSGDFIKAYGASDASNLRFRVSNTGNVSADGSISGGGADFAEMLPAGEDALEPGDVLCIGPDGSLVKSSAPRSKAVAGVYSTKPGFLGGNSDEDSVDGKIPLAVVGVVPVKVCAENGAIAPGDLLTASSSPGRAMNAGNNPPSCTVIGKALGSLQSGEGIIQMLVTLQ